LRPALTFAFAIEVKMALPQTPALATDCVIFDPVGRVLLIRRKHEPSAGRHSLPGGFVKIGETVEAACRREVREEAGMEVSELTLVGVYSDLKRDPRGHIVSVAYATQLPSDAVPRAGSDAASAEWVDTRQITLGFDHARILADAKDKVAKRLGDDLDRDFPEGGG
jgi:8-oxo-dGTP diphosphatase